MPTLRTQGEQFSSAMTVQSLTWFRPKHRAFFVEVQAYRGEKGMSKIDDGGPAFANVVSIDCVRVEMDGSAEYEPSVHGGNLSVRDYFAAHADIPWNAVIETLRLKGRQNPTIAEIMDYRALLKYEEADALLAARATGDADEGVK